MEKCSKFNGVPKEAIIDLRLNYSSYPLVDKEEEKNGRFFLYPTTNIYNFILLDQIDGRTWQVQWGKEGERGVLRIY